MKRNNLMKEGERQKTKGRLYNTQTQEERKTLKKERLKRKKHLGFNKGTLETNEKERTNTHTKKNAIITTVTTKAIMKVLKGQLHFLRAFDLMVIM